MVISKLNLPKIDRDLALIQEYLLELEKLAPRSWADFQADPLYAAAAESFLRRTLEAVFDINRHIVAKSFGKKELEYKALGRVLGEKKVFSKTMVEKLVKMAGYRNRMVHFYKEITPKELHRILKKDLPDVRLFVTELDRFLQRYHRQKPDQ